MRNVKFTITGQTPYSGSRYHEEPRLENEGHEDYDRRTALAKLHTSPKGLVVIPGVQMKQALEWTTSYFGETVPEKGKRTWTKFFKAATMALSDLDLGVKPDAAHILPLRSNSQGRKGGSLNVTRYFPVLAEWEGSMEFAIFDDTIKPKVFEKYVTAAGRFCGLGRWRPSNGGANGRFTASKFNWS